MGEQVSRDSPWSLHFSDEEAFVCPDCRHCFTRWFDPNTVEWKPGTPQPPILPEYACAECRERLRKHGYPLQDDGPAPRGAGAGVVIPGVNG